MANRIKHVGFDLDGTLLDTREQIVESITACLEPGQRVAARPIILERAHTSPKAILRQFGIQRLDAYWRHHAELAHLARPFFNDTPIMLGKLRDMGITLSVVTSLPSPAANALLKMANLADHFCLVDTFASRKHRKPSPALLKIHLQELGVPPEEAVYVGDSEGDMRMAKAAGVGAFGAGWGTKSIEALIRAGADCILNSPEELIEAVKTRTG